jgi:hypothetical protein
LVVLADILVAEAEMVQVSSVGVLMVRILRMVEVLAVGKVFSVAEGLMVPAVGHQMVGILAVDHQMVGILAVDYQMVEDRMKP